MRRPGARGRFSFGLAHAVDSLASAAATSVALVLRARSSGVNTPMTVEVTGLSAAVSAGDKLQATFTTPSGSSTVPVYFRVTIYLQ